MANLRRSHGAHEFYYPLDNSAIFIASVTGKASPYIYRMSCELDAPVYLPDLEKALAMVLERFPFLKTELRPGLFWYYLDPMKTPFRLTADSRFPVEYHRLKRWGRYLFRVRVFGARIACEFHHILTDGTGAIEFLRSLVAMYLSLRGVVCSDWQDIKKPGAGLDPAEFEDAYADLLKKHVPKPGRLPAAFRLTGRRYPGIIYRITTGTAPVSRFLEIARERKVSLTELLAAIYLYTLQSVAESRSTSGYKPICIQIPVNMRRLYPSRTLRNFFLFVPLSIDRRLGHYEFDEILTRVHYSMRLNLDIKEMDRQIRRNVGGERNLFSRVVPLVIKNIVLRLMGKVISDKPFSGSLSNLQQVNMPAAFADHIRRFDFIPVRNDLTGANVGVISWKDKLSVTIGSLLIDRSFERAFFTTCVGLGIPVTVESNL